MQWPTIFLLEFDFYHIGKKKALLLQRF